MDSVTSPREAELAKLPWDREGLVEYAAAFSGTLDLGIARAVRILREADLHTIESCEGGPDHSYPEPTVKFSGTPACGWKAAAQLMYRGLPIKRLGQVWTFEYGLPTGPDWIVTFTRKLDS